MKKFSLMAAIIVLGFIAQTSLFNFFNIFGTVPNLSLVLIVVFSMMSDGITGGVLGILTGVVYDAMLYDVFGIYTLVYFIIGAIIGTYSEDMLRDNYIAYTSVTAAATIACNFFMYLILFFLRYKVGNAGGIWSGIIVEVLMNTFLVVFVLKFINFTFNKFNIK
ncbi:MULTISPECIES: rod shape-determining protein MreD [unclassified Sedimentibacter]|uniref:rod shape-determining protein MreD n=1 Tax=unclassified Sedimentibacter TaxID=2649220 RepID=UPI0027E0A247|nr:rod shape-determining protein MreD [Sedimentibacter sp. MB35-C1]WMJ75886.1 rod shape-determining protein MreD [Sedimentibacter sp. MB35-C1]